MAHTPIKVLDKVVEIIELLATSHKGVKLKNVTESLHLNKTTSLRILRALESHHLATRDGNGTFLLGDRVLWWEACHRRNFELLSLVLPYLEKLRDATAETATFSILAGHRTVFVEQAVSLHVTSSRFALGTSARLNAGASGKVVLAHLASEERKEFLERARWDSLTLRTITARDQLEKELEECRRRGFALSKGERFPNTTSIAAPVVGPASKVIGAVSVVGPSDRLTHRRCAEVARVLLKETKQLSSALKGMKFH